MDAFDWNCLCNYWYYTDIGKMCYNVCYKINEVMLAKDPESLEESTRLEMQCKEWFCEAYEHQTQQYGHIDYKVDRSQLQWNPVYEEE